MEVGNTTTRSDQNDIENNFNNRHEGGVEFE